MRGTVLLVDAGRTGSVDPQSLRANGLMVHDTTEVAHALERLVDLGPDVIVTVLSSGESPSYLSEMRRRSDHATSILVVSTSEKHREAARRTGADAFLLSSEDLLYEIHRALILRRSGRRLTWLW